MLRRGKGINMRKSIIWLLALVMAFAFAGLLFLQVKYVSIILKTRSEQFNETVKRCLNQVSKDLEMEETRKYLENDISEDSKNFIYKDPAEIKKELEQFISKEDFKFKIDTNDALASIQANQFISKKLRTLPNISGPLESKNIISTSKELQDAFMRRYFTEQKLIEEVVLNILYTGSLKPIEERIDVKNLKNSLKAEFLDNGLNLPFVFSVINKDGNTVYRSEVTKKKPLAADIITQALFPNDPPSRQNYMRVYFPSKKDYLASSITFIIPSAIFSFMLLITFSMTIYIVFRQKKLSKMKNDFINNMTHELKTPVSTISLAAQMLKDKEITKNMAVFMHISTVINEETKRLGFLVEKVLQMSLFERQKTALKLKEMDANDLIINVANTFVLKVQKYGGTLDVDLQATESTILVDEMHITNVVFNLLDNAVKYRRPDVPLKLMVRSKNEGKDKITLSVEDNGIGIKKEYLKKVFDRFFRVPKGNVHDVKGFGLGLAYVQKILLDLQGSIRAEVGDNNQGTKFIITLPIIKS